MPRRAALWGVAAALALGAFACALPDEGPESPPAPSPVVALPGPTATATPTPTPTPVQQPLVLVDGTAFVVELAVTAQERRRGLAGRESLPPGHGMLFVLEEEQVTAFTMGGMRFPLDILWVSSDLRVADVTQNAPPSRTGEPFYWPRAPVRYVLEVNAGEVAAHGILPGAPVEFRGVPALERS